MRKALSAAAVFLLATAAVNVARSDEPTKLRWRFTKDAKPEYTVSQNLASMGGGQTTSQKAVFGYTYELKGMKGEIAQLDLTYDRVKMTMVVPFGQFEYDSGDEKKGSVQGGPLAGLFKVFDAMVGAPIEVSVAQDGKLDALKMPEAVSSELEKLSGPVAGSFGEDGMRQTVSLAFLPTPAAAVEPGDTWKRQSAVATPLGKMVYDVTYTYLGPNSGGGANLEKIGVETKVSLEPSSEVPFEIKIKSQESKGTALFDNEAGRLHSLDEVVKLELELSVPGNPVISQEVSYKIVQGKGDTGETSTSEDAEK